MYKLQGRARTRPRPPLVRVRAAVNRGNFFAVDFRQNMQILHRYR